MVFRDGDSKLTYVTVGCLNKMEGKRVTRMQVWGFGGGGGSCLIQKRREGGRERGRYHYSRGLGKASPWNWKNENKQSKIQPAKSLQQPTFM